MDDAKLLLAACALRPDDDLARVVYADLCEERGDADYARFVREQVRLAPLPSWHPDSVRAKWHEPALVDGAAFADRLPPSGTRAWEWPARDAFHRGLPGTVLVRDLTGFVDYSRELFDALPIRELHLPTAALSEWRRFTHEPWLPRVEAVRFYGVSTPIEALRALCETPNATGLTSIALEKAGGPAIPMLLADLFASPLGWQLRRLELHARIDDEEYEWIEAMRGVGSGYALRELSLRTMGLTYDAYRRLTDLPLARSLTTLELTHNSLGNFSYPTVIPVPVNLEKFGVIDSRAELLSGLQYDYFLRVRGLKQVEIGYGSGRPAWPRRTPPELVSLGLSRCGLPATSVPGMVASDFWQRAVELDLRGNMLYRHGLELLIDAGPGPELVALVLDRNHAATSLGRQFAERYGGRVTFA